MKKTFYITTTLPYVNANPHLGHALEFVRADIIARYHKLIGEDIFFNTGTDEHGQKVQQKADEEGKKVQTFIDEYADIFKKLIKKLGLIKEVNFIRTTDSHHINAAQEFWKRCKKNGYIEKRNYQAKYCVGCELEKTDSELDDGKCPYHLNRKIELINEENYFFKFSEFKEKLLNLYKNNPNFVIPSFRFNEIKKLIEDGSKDFSISRLKSKMSWGVEVPDDPDHIMYVWFDALVNYISAIGWPDNLNNFKKWWPVTQYCGKDNIRQQSAMWQAMLMSVGLSPSKQIIINGFINIRGQKMSKSSSNVIDPIQLVDEYGTDALRYYIAREINQFEDSDFTVEGFKESYNANLANGLGNLVSRIMKMAESYLEKCPEISEQIIPNKFKEYLDKFEIKKAIDLIWERIAGLDSRIQKEQPFKLIKENKEEAIKIIEDLVINLYIIGLMLNPILPETSQKIKTIIKKNKMPDYPLFLRKD